MLLSFDVPLGVPGAFLSASAAALGRRADTFLEWLRVVRGRSDFFEPVRRPEDWRPDRPFFAVPKGTGALKAFEAEAARQNATLRRELDKALHAKSPFITSGIPGSVGSSVCDLWQALDVTRDDVRLWPFAGRLGELLAPGRVVVGEIYPRAAYAMALNDDPQGDRVPLNVHKVVPACRKAAVDCLLGKPWVARWKVEVQGADRAIENEDDFDAMLTAAALLRCALETWPLDGDASAPTIEGGILCTKALDTRLPARRFSYPAAGARSRPLRSSGQPRPEPTARRCPIPGCGHMYKAGRSGFDAHVGSPRLHPAWHPGVTDAARRIALFREDFREWFRDAE